MSLTPHFSLEEMVASQTATRKGINNVPDARAVAALTRLCEAVLEPIRVHFDKVVHISSGYRSPRLNKAIGGTETSQHCFGEAADIVCYGVDNLDLAKWIRDNLPFDQVIMEGTWVHVSHGPRNRRQALTAHFAKGKPTTYTAGL
jgi:hypothetical protein